MVPDVQNIPMVCEYPDIFPKDLPRLPPPCEIEFSIKLILDVQPFSKVLYRMAPAELMELKIYKN